MTVLKRTQCSGVEVLTLNRPEKRNALNLELWECLREELSRLRAEHARCLVITGAGVAFCGGGDWVEASTAGPQYLKHVYAITHEVVLSLYRLPCPTIAMIHGTTIGAGLELALACDFRFAGAAASFAVGFTRFAAPPEAISAAMLPRLLGPERAKRFVFGEERWNGEQAQRYGLVSELFEDDELQTQTMTFAEGLECGPTGALAMGKALMDESFEQSVEATIKATYEQGVASQQSEDAAEAMQAMVERRQPVFTGR